MHELFYKTVRGMPLTSCLCTGEDKREGDIFERVIKCWLILLQKDETNPSGDSQGQ
jgi:hypothetical protein